MSTPAKKVVVLKAGSRVSSLPETPGREFWMDQREGLLRQLAAIEKMLGISRRCRNCGSDVTKTG